MKGLTGSEVKDLTSRGFVNGEQCIKTKSVARIVSDNICTLFNLINIVLAILVAVTGSFKNMLFMGVIICNVAIGIFQEIRAKRTIDRLSLLSAPVAHVIRDDKEEEIPMSAIVLGDLCHIRRGDQICSDCTVTDGECEVDESLLTGESDSVHKKTGDELLSGSFIVSGDVFAKVTHIGEENYAYKLVKEAKHLSKPNSEMMRAINKIIKTVSIAIVPIAAILFYKQCFVIGDNVDVAIISTVAALIAMIPEGLVLLTSAVLAVSVVRLSKEKTLVQELYCIETLARVDVLCLDKTGTITEGRMRLKDVILANESGGAEELEKTENILTEFVGAIRDVNPTLLAIADKYPPSHKWMVTKVNEFSSERKCSSVTFDKEGEYILGACEFVIGENSEAVTKAGAYAENGERVLVLVKNGEVKELLAYILIEDVIRADAKETLEYFDRQGVELKIISGDSPATVAAVAKRAGIAEVNYIDMTTCTTEQEITSAATKYNVFGRVTPSQKLSLVKALKSNGNTVGMTGDGVNDVLALKEADCSIAMQSGSDAARNVSKLVLLDSNFASMPKIVAEGRRSINNLERSASLFLEKTVYATLLAVIFVFLFEPYPFKPIQLTLVSALTIGIPSFLLALEPNYDVVKGKFLTNVMRRAIPGGVMIVADVLLSIIAGKIFDLTPEQVSTLSAVMVAIVAFIVLFRVCLPWNGFRALMYAVLAGAFALAVICFGEFFLFSAVTAEMALIILGLTIISIPVVALLIRVTGKIMDTLTKKEEKYVRE